MPMNGFNRICGGYKMLKKNNASGFLFVITVLITLLVSCSNNRLANTTWQDTGGTRTLTFTKTAVIWQRSDTGFDKIGTYTISEDTITISFDDMLLPWRGTFIDGELSIMANPGYADAERVEFHRIR